MNKLMLASLQAILVSGAIGCAHDPCVRTPAAVVAAFQDPILSDLTDFAKEGVTVCEMGNYLIVTSGDEDAEEIQIFRKKDLGKRSTLNAVFGIYSSKLLEANELHYTLWQNGLPDITLKDSDRDSTFDILSYSVPIEGEGRRQLHINDRNFDGVVDSKNSSVDGKLQIWLWIRESWRSVHLDPNGHTVEVDGERREYQWNGTEYKLRPHRGSEE